MTATRGAVTVWQSFCLSVYDATKFDLFLTEDTYHYKTMHIWLFEQSSLKGLLY